MDVKQNSQRKTYSKEFKLMIVQLRLEGHGKDSLARRFGIQTSMVERWGRKYKAGGEDALGENRGRTRNPRPPKTYVEELEARVRHLEMENAVLKKLKELERRDAGQD